MLDFFKKRLPQIIAYFSKLHYQKTKRYLTQNQLYKYLVFLDYFAVKEMGRPVTGLRYVASDQGPVPEELYRDIKKGYSYDEGLYKVLITDKEVLIAPGEATPDLDLLTEWEKAKINELIEAFAERWDQARHIPKNSYQEIKAWGKAFTRGVGSVIDWKDEIEQIQDENKRKLFFERLETFNLINK